MTIAPARPLSDPRTRGLHLGRSAAMALLRCAVLVGAGMLFDRVVTSTPANYIGVGLASLALTMALVGGWALLDGWRQPLRTGAVAWAATSALFVLLGQLPRILSYPADEGGWTGLPDYLSMVSAGAGFTFALVAVPAMAGGGLGHLIRTGYRHSRRTR